MFDMNTLLRFFDRGFIVKFFLILLLLSLIMLGDSFLLLVMAPFIGNYAILGVTATIGLIGLVMVVNEVHKRINKIRVRIKDGVFPSGEFDSMAGLIFAGILLIIPGFFTDFLGIVLFVPLLQKTAGRLLTRHLQVRLRQAYEYMKIEEY